MTQPKQTESYLLLLSDPSSRKLELRLVRLPGPRLDKLRLSDTMSSP